MLKKQKIKRSVEWTRTKGIRSKGVMEGTMYQVCEKKER